MIRNKAQRRPRHRGAAAFLYGAAHAMDFAGILAQNRGRFAEGLQADAAALHQDWQSAFDVAAQNESDGEE